MVLTIGDPHLEKIGTANTKKKVRKTFFLLNLSCKLLRRHLYLPQSRDPSRRVFRADRACQRGREDPEVHDRRGNRQVRLLLSRLSHREDLRFRAGQTFLGRRVVQEVHDRRAHQVDRRFRYGLAVQGSREDQADQVVQQHLFHPEEVVKSCSPPCPIS